MKEIDVARIKESVAALCIKANRQLTPDLVGAIKKATATEINPLAKSIMSDIELNLAAAEELSLPICQDTGMAVVFLEIGQEVHFVGGSLEEAVNEGVRKGYTEGLLRKSVVSDPIRRVNTNDNTPAIIHTRIVDGENVKITVAPKGFGSENMSGIRMLTPAATREDIISAVTEIVRTAGSNPCPPMVIGVGIGGDFEYAAILAKKALCRSGDERNSDPYYAELEADMLSSVNALGIGPQGFGGETTALYVNIESFATHIAGLPVAVNIGCHVTRHATEIL
ncbi:MAG: fumarate hydratase [Clostridia bacterium]|nr:fumarate hydratase [Clostridia bacterium]MBQ9957851.1 fumarate hydratase [Clostridia bacterium]